MRALCAPDKFRGTLTAAEAARALAAGFRDAGVDDVDELPLADGGEGTLDVLLAALGGELHEAEVTGPDGASIRSSWGLLPDGIAVVELARASGLALVAGANDPVTATTRGTGELIAAAAAGGATGVLVGAGGSATVDGGLGAIEALGWSLPLPVTVACDVDTLFSTRPASSGRRRAPARRRSNCSPGGSRASPPPTGTAPASTSRRCPARGRPVDSPVGSQRSAPRSGRASPPSPRRSASRRDSTSATIVVTGEGRLDETSLAGKVAVEVLRAAAERGTQAAVVAGEIAEGVVRTTPGAAARRLSRPARRLARPRTPRRSGARSQRRPGGSRGIPTADLSRAVARDRMGAARGVCSRVTAFDREEHSEMNARRLGAGAALLAIGVAALALAAASSAGQTAAYKAAWIYVGPHNDNGWSQAHDKGRLAVQRALGVEGEDDLQGARPRGPADLPGDREPDP